jgi:molybdopterin-guanine dinucleotide biosynthesis protein A
MAFSGAVLTGGRSSRLGTDKALVEIAGRPMASIAHRALIDGGASHVVAIGGDGRALIDLGLEFRPDSAPGEGPLGGILDALGGGDDELVVILACDQPNVTAALVRHVVEAIEANDDAAVPVIDGMPQPLAAVYARRARVALQAAFEAGERSPRRALGRLRWRAITDIEPSWVEDVDEPRDLARYAAGRTPSPTDPR